MAKMYLVENFDSGDKKLFVDRYNAMREVISQFIDWLATEADIEADNESPNYTVQDMLADMQNFYDDGNIEDIAYMTEITPEDECTN